MYRMVDLPALEDRMGTRTLTNAQHYLGSRIANRHPRTPREPLARRGRREVAENYRQSWAMRVVMTLVSVPQLRGIGTLLRTTLECCKTRDLGAKVVASCPKRHIEAPFVGQRPAGFLNTSDLRVLRVGSVMAKVEIPVTTAWDDQAQRANAGTTTDACAKRDRFDLTLTLHSVDIPKRQLKLEVAIVPAPPLGTPKDAWYVPEHRQLHTTVIVGDQQPIMLGGEAMSQRDTPSILVATPYILSVPEHLNELFQCRMNTATKAREQQRNVGQ
jgi:hypothetical protein